MKNDFFEEETESVEVIQEEIISSERTPKSAFWGNAVFYILMGMLALLPVWIFPFKGSIGMSRSFLIFFAVLVAVVFYLIKTLQEGKFKISRSFLFIFLGAVSLVNLVSALFSSSAAFSLFGDGGSNATFMFLFFSSLALFLSFLAFDSEKKVSSALVLLMISSSVVFVLQCLKIFAGFSFGGFLSETFFGSWNEMGIFFGLVGLLAVIFLQFLKPQKKFRVFLSSLLAASFVAMFFVNFTSGWIVFGTIILVLFVYMFSFSQDRQKLIGLLLFLILAVILFVLSKPLIGDIVSSVGLNYVEIRPTWSTMVDISSKIFNSGVKNALLGTGPNTFIYSWDMFKPIAINQTAFWNFRFTGGSGALPVFIINSGLLGLVAWILFLCMFVYYGFKAIVASREDKTKGLMLATFLGAAYLWIFAIIYSVGNLMLFLAFLFTGLFIAMLVNQNILPLKEVSFLKKSSLSFISSLIIVLLLIVSVAVFYLFFQKYWAAHSYSRGLEAFKDRGDINESRGLIEKALSFDKQDKYFRSLSEIGLIELSRLLSAQNNLTQDEIRLRFQNTLAYVIQNAQGAIEVNPADYLNWLTLGRVYSNILPLGINGAEQAALEAFSLASEKAPFNPIPLFESARVELQVGNNEKAMQYLNSTLQLKSDYTDALFILAQLTARGGDLQKAIAQTAQAQLTAPNDVGILFQLGLLYYQAGDYGNAKTVFERTVIINPSYSNARYFLGLIYDRDGRRQDAIGQFEEIAKLNPDNQEVKIILSNLKSGRKALSNISPPDLAPEERDEPPIDEDGDSSKTLLETSGE